MSAQPTYETGAQVAQLVERLDLNSPALHDEQLPFEVYRGLRATQPVKRVEPRGRPAAEWFVSRYRNVVAVFQDNENFTSEEMTAGGIPGPISTAPVSLDDVDPYIVATHSQKIPLALDPPEFSVYRPLLNPLFSPGQARKTEWASREIAGRLIDPINGCAAAEFHHELAKPLPAMLICRLLGLPEQEWERFAITTPESLAYFAMEQTPETVMGRVIPSLDAQMTMLRLADERRRDPQEDIITAVAHLTVDGRLLNFYELGAILSVLLSGGVHTTTLAIEAALAYLGRNPAVHDELAQHPERVKPFCEEILRMWPPLHLFFRKAKRDVAVGGQPIAAGDTLILGLASANRDPDEFPDPDTFRIGRHPNRHITFAVGIHRCLGSSLARQELLVTIEEVLRRLPPFTIDESCTSIPAMLETVHDPTRRLTALFAG